MHILLYGHVHISVDMVRRRKTYNITLPDDVAQWIDDMVEKRIFANRSHGIEVAVRRLMNAEEEKQSTK